MCSPLMYFIDLEVRITFSPFLTLNFSRKCFNVTLLSLSCGFNLYLTLCSIWGSSDFIAVMSHVGSFWQEQESDLIYWTFFVCFRLLWLIDFHTMFSLRKQTHSFRYFTFWPPCLAAFLLHAKCWRKRQLFKTKPYATESKLQPRQTSAPHSMTLENMRLFFMFPNRHNTVG